MKAEDMELSLELSIGGCYKNMDNVSRTHQKIGDIDENENNTSSRSDLSENYGVGCLQDEIFSSDSADPRRKREIQALRRREAIRKRDEKQKRWSKRGVNESNEELLVKKARGDICLNSLKVLQNGNSSGGVKLEQRSNGVFERSASVFLEASARSSSTDTGSHSNYSQGGQQQSSATATSNTPERSDLKGPSSSHARSDQANANGKIATLLPTMSSSDTPTTECSNSRKCEPLNKPTPTPQEQASSASRKCNESMIKPPVPQRNTPDSTPLPRMPLVSTTGNGPNGKTVNGFLYSYSKSEVSIVCVCHGSSFSPAEFVEHAGGMHVSHPLKHITIVPTHFG